MTMRWGRHNRSYSSQFNYAKQTIWKIPLHPSTCFCMFVFGVEVICILFWKQYEWKVTHFPFLITITAPPNQHNMVLRYVVIVLYIITFQREQNRNSIQHRIICPPRVGILYWLCHFRIKGLVGVILVHLDTPVFIHQGRDILVIPYENLVVISWFQMNCVPYQYNIHTYIQYP